MKIGSKLIALGSAILLIPLGTVGILVTNRASESVLLASKGNVDNMARSMADYTDLRLQGDTRFVIGLAEDGDIKALLGKANAGIAKPDEVSRLNGKLAALQKDAALNAQFDSVSVIDKRGRIAACPIPELVGMDLSQMEFFKTAISGKAGVGPLVIDEKQPPNAGITAPVHDAKGEIIGVCGIFLNPIKNLSELSKYKLGKSGYFFVVDRGGLIIFHPDKDIMLKKNARDIPGWEPLSAGLAAGKAGGVAYSHKGQAMIGAFSPVAANGWMVVASMPTSEFQTVAIELRLMIASIAVVSFIAAFIALLFLSRSISRALVASTSIGHRLAEGDLTTAGQAQISRRKDEIGDLVKAFADMQSHLREVAGKAKDVTAKVAGGSEAISATAQQLSQGSTEQAASAEEISSSVEEMSSTIRQNADNAQATEGIALKAAQNAERGSQAVTNSVDAMKQIVERISIIENIASQTNLLALNAAIEAARAGESGKGFAVVASEVRKLAERSAKAASEITELSNNTMAAASEASELIGAIVPDIKKTADLVQEIASASREQSVGIEQIQKAMTQLDSVIQQNASASEEMAGMAEELAGEADELKGTIAYFKLGGEAAAGPGARAAAEPRAKAAPRRSIVPVQSAKPAADAHDSDFEEF
jgi:methyl-accepting chemotaxis protein